MAMSPILLIIASEGFQQVEYAHTKKALEDASLIVKIASNTSKAAIAKDGSSAAVDVVLDKVNPTDYAGIFFIGGPGALENLDNETSFSIIRRARDAQIPVGAICISPRILAHAGILAGKKATGWNGDNQLEQVFKEHDVIYTREDVVTDDGIVTAVGPAQATAFGQAIVVLIKQNNR